MVDTVTNDAAKSAIDTVNEAKAVIPTQIAKEKTARDSMVETMKLLAAKKRNVGDFCIEKGNPDINGFVILREPTAIGIHRGDDGTSETYDNYGFVVATANGFKVYGLENVSNYQLDRKRAELQDSVNIIEADPKAQYNSNRDWIVASESGSSSQTGYKLTDLSDASVLPDVIKKSVAKAQEKPLASIGKADRTINAATVAQVAVTQVGITSGK